jgi:hypothetical protein
MVHVPYKGSAPAQQDVIGGRVPLLFDILYSSMPFVQDKRLKVIALSSPKRAECQSGDPLIADTLPGFSAMSSIGIIAPGGPAARAAAEDQRRRGPGRRSPEIVRAHGAAGPGAGGLQLRAVQRPDPQEIDKWSAIVKTAASRSSEEPPDHEHLNLKPLQPFAAEASGIDLREPLTPHR